MCKFNTGILLGFRHGAWQVTLANFRFVQMCSLAYSTSFWHRSCLNDTYQPVGGMVKSFQKPWKLTVLLVRRHDRSQRRCLVQKLRNLKTITLVLKKSQKMWKPMTIPWREFRVAKCNQGIQWGRKNSKKGFSNQMFLLVNPIISTFMSLTSQVP